MYDANKVDDRLAWSFGLGQQQQFSTRVGTTSADLSQTIDSKMPFTAANVGKG